MTFSASLFLYFYSNLTTLEVKKTNVNKSKDIFDFCGFLFSWWTQAWFRANEMFHWFGHLMNNTITHTCRHQAVSTLTKWTWH